MCDIEIEEYPKVWRENKRKARKEHRCSCCRGQIKAGEMYLVHFSVSSDGDANSEKLCGLCIKDRDDFAAAHGGILAAPGGFEAMLDECVAEEDDEDKKWLPIIERIEATRATYRREKEAMQKQGSSGE